MNQRAVDALRVVTYSPSHPIAHLYRKNNLIWDIPEKLGQG